MLSLQACLWLVPLSPLVASLLVGLLGTRFFGKKQLIGRSLSHWVSCLGVLLSFLVSCFITIQGWEASQDQHLYNDYLYVWDSIGWTQVGIGFLVDRLTLVMMLVVTFVSLMVHVYTIAYMSEDPGYQRFFSYISLFTFAMLMLVMSNNFLQLFFGWEAVGLVSYLLIGFWYDRPTAVHANLKAFLVNRVGDLGFLLGIALIFNTMGSLDYETVFLYNGLPELAEDTLRFLPGEPSTITLICILLFIGAMGKSAQFPLHVWLPDSMEGPTPISALIHAATMVTAGIFMVARMSPLFELSDTALSFVLVIGAITAFFTGLMGMVQNDIKRVIAYSTLSQLGYMTVALGSSAYGIAIFHLATHAFFKALLFLAAGSVIMGSHHNQDIRYMGGIKRYMPVTWITSLLASMSLIGVPFFSGFYSKDGIIDAVRYSNLPLASFVYWSVLLGVFITAFYSFRLYFLVFHGAPRYHLNPEADGEVGVPHESPLTVIVPLILLAIPSVMIGYVLAEPIFVGDMLGDAIYTLSEHAAVTSVGEQFTEHGYAWGMGWHGWLSAPCALALGGVVTAYFLCIRKPHWAQMLEDYFSGLHRLLINRYYLDWFNEHIIASLVRRAGNVFWRKGDLGLIDGWGVGGAVRGVAGIARGLSWFQSGLIYQYALVMLIGVIFGGVFLFFEGW